MNQVNVRHISRFLEHWAPLNTQMEYDNAGLILGSPDTKVNGILTCLDITEKIIDEAIKKGCNVIISHHPLIFKGLKSIRTDLQQGILLKKILKYDIQIIAAHTNLDAALNGVSYVLAALLGLKKIKFLHNDLKTLVRVWFSHNQPSEAIEFLNAIGAWQIERNDENISAIMENYQLSGLEKFAGSPVMHTRLNSPSPQHGFGVIGTFEEPIGAEAFLDQICSKLDTTAIRFAGNIDAVKKIAVCGGSGAPLIPIARLAGADAFVTSDIKYHDFFEASSHFMLVDAGHYETEFPVVGHLAAEMSTSFPGLLVLPTEHVTNPMKLHHNILNNVTIK